MFNRSYLRPAAALLLLAVSLSTPAAAEVFDDFELINTTVGAPFTIGTAPEEATFSGDAFSGVAGIGELYFSGSHAWMVNPDGVGNIAFEANAASVTFWTRLRSGANGASIYTAYDDANQVVDSFTISTPAAFQLLTFAGNIDRIEVVNNATGNGQMNSIDDIRFTAVPEPTAATLSTLAVFALSWRRRKQ